MRIILIILFVGFAILTQAQDATTQKERAIKGLDNLTPTIQTNVDFRGAIVINQNKKQHRMKAYFVLSKQDIKKVNQYTEYITFHEPSELHNQSRATRDDFSYPFLLNSCMNNYVIGPLLSNP